MKKKPDNTSADPLRIALFGGSFDPVHDGHIQLAKQAKEACNLDQVRFIPARISPFKVGESPPAPDSDRSTMLKLATKDLPWAIVDDYELTQEPPSYSYLTAREMRKRFPSSTLFWLMGSDQWEQLSMWKNIDELAQCVSFLVFTRGTIPRAQNDWKMQYFPFSHPASSTEIRSQLASAKSAFWLPPEVANYIRNHDLYQAKK